MDDIFDSLGEPSNRRQRRHGSNGTSAIRRITWLAVGLVVAALVAALVMANVDDDDDDDGDDDGRRAPVEHVLDDSFTA